ncbi:hypothetical protein N656DRAFT_69038 [Canariomyces notabilis]|uniref:Uncharacterized protein n=1 Tax=Canariomyces notabilis TaxID=2074819 RepID=A0AAN6TNV6_9PEZI|nr:hypothetical protein N656DRAFT_69038 [Canariomyces arenarius]
MTTFHFMLLDQFYRRTTGKERKCLVWHGFTVVYLVVVVHLQPLQGLLSVQAEDRSLASSL